LKDVFSGDILAPVIFTGIGVFFLLCTVASLLADVRQLWSDLARLVSRSGAGAAR
jgi:hypothetical protein